MLLKLAQDELYTFNKKLEDFDKEHGMTGTKTAKSFALCVNALTRRDTHHIVFKRAADVMSDINLRSSISSGDAASLLNQDTQQITQRAKTEQYLRQYGADVAEDPMSKAEELQMACCLLAAERVREALISDALTEEPRRIPVLLKEPLPTQLKKCKDLLDLEDRKTASKLLDKIGNIINLRQEHRVKILSSSKDPNHKLIYQELKDHRNAIQNLGHNPDKPVLQFYQSHTGTKLRIHPTNGRHGGQRLETSAPHLVKAAEQLRPIHSTDFTHYEAAQELQDSYEKPTGENLSKSQKSPDFPGSSR